MARTKGHTSRRAVILSDSESQEKEEISPPPRRSQHTQRRSSSKTLPSNPDDPVYVNDTIEIDYQEESSGNKEEQEGSSPEKKSDDGNEKGNSTNEESTPSNESYVSASDKSDENLNSSPKDAARNDQDERTLGLLRDIAASLLVPSKEDCERVNQLMLVKKGNTSKGPSAAKKQSQDYARDSANESEDNVPLVKRKALAASSKEPTAKKLKVMTSIVPDPKKTAPNPPLKTGPSGTVKKVASPKKSAAALKSQASTTEAKKQGKKHVPSSSFHPTSNEEQYNWLLRNKTIFPERLVDMKSYQENNVSPKIDECGLINTFIRVFQYVKELIYEFYANLSPAIVKEGAPEYMKVWTRGAYRDFNPSLINSLLAQVKKKSLSMILVSTKFVLH